jgi:hypothetical protein
MIRRSHPSLPSRQQYEEMAEDLSRKPSTIEPGLTIFLLMLFLMPVAGYLCGSAFGLFGGTLSSVLRIAALFGASGLSMLEAYRGLVQRRVRILPRSRVRNEGAHVGGKMKEVVTGRAAAAVGVLFVCIGLAALSGAVWQLLGLL